MVSSARAASASALAALEKRDDDAEPEDLPADAKVPLKYWMQRFRLFSRFDEGRAGRVGAG